MLPNKEITVLLNAASAGDKVAPDKLLELVYDDLRRLAAKYMQNERSDHTLQATAFQKGGNLVSLFKGKLLIVFHGNSSMSSSKSEDATPTYPLTTTSRVALTT
ncbi:MAG: ECF-type sigma factor [Acidobacteriota bacterium]|nr:ECF-type sigma factor [Acidobacteriota bacterium]MDQ3088945.1 ECF-type sigma factor [Acidobacteriota bacterium]